MAKTSLFHMELFGITKQNMFVLPNLSAQQISTIYTNPNHKWYD